MCHTARHSVHSACPLPRVEALQNALSLTCRTFDSGLAEVCHQEGVSLLAYSPLAMGWLTVSELKLAVCCFDTRSVRPLEHAAHHFADVSSHVRMCVSATRRVSI